MRTINMTFEVPEAKGINIEALKQNIRAYFNLVISSPSVLSIDTPSSDKVTEQMLNRFAGCWHGDETADEIISRINESKSVREPLSL